MKTIVVFPLLTFLFINSLLAQNWQWGQNFESNGNVIVTNVITDDQKNAYVLGMFDNDLTISGTTLINVGDWDIFLASFKGDGNFRWAIKMGGIGRELLGNLALDNSGNIYIVGSYKNNTIYFTQNDSLENTGKADAFYAIYTTSGTFQNAVRLFWGSNAQTLANICFNPKNNLLYGIGFFRTDINYFDGSTNQVITASNIKDHFIAEINTSGFVQNIAIFPGNQLVTNFKEISLCNEGGFFVGGDLMDTLYLSTTKYLIGNGGNTDIMLLRIDDNLNYLWGRLGKGTGYDHVNSMASDVFSNVYITGKTESNPITFDSTATDAAVPLPGFGGTDLYIAKYNREGNLQWIRRKGNTGNDNSYGLAVFENLVEFAGIYSGQLIFNNDTLDSGSLTNINTGFAIYDVNGNEIGAQEITGDLDDEGTAVAMDNNGKTYISGNFSSTAIHAGPLSLTNTNSPNLDGFLFKYSYPFSPAFTKKQNVTCPGGSDGELIVTPYFGVGPYTYSWSHDSDLADSVATNLSAGDYSVTVIDGNGAVSTISTTITQPDPILSPAVVTDVSCVNGADGAIDITVSGGTPPYTFLWSTSNGSGLDQTAEDQSGLTAGDYALRITDSHGCTKDTSIVVHQPDPITFGGSTVTHIERPPGSNGAIDLVVSGGTPAYTYYWEGPNGFTATTQDLSGLDDGGTYTVTVTDQNHCTGDTSFLVEDKTALLATIDSIKDVTCYGGSDGYAHVAVTGGSGNYDYQWTNSVGTPIGANSPSLKDVPAGTYYVTVTDQLDARTTSTSATVKQPDYSLTVFLSSVNNVTCKGLNDGMIDITVSGGWLPYTFTWTGLGGSFSANTEDVADLQPGYYSVTITDAGGCEVYLTNIQITEPEALVTTIHTNSTILCHGELTGELEAMPSGGTGAYTYSWDDPGHQTTKAATYLEAGTYTVTVTDDNGCTAQATESLSQPDAITVTAAVEDVSCPGKQDGSIVLTVSGGTVPYQFLWSPDNETSKDLTNISGGDYTVTITDNNNCTWDSTYTVAEPEAITVDSVSVTEITGCSGSANGALVIHASGGTAPLEYSADGGVTWQAGNSFSDLGAGDYDIAVRDAHGCEIAGNTITLTDPPGVVIDNVDVTNVSCHGETDGSLVIMASGGIKPYSYSVDGGTTFWPDSIFSDLPAGNYDIAVRDPNGCITYGNTVPLTEPEPIVIADPDTDPTCPGDNEGAIMVTATGGTGTLTFLLTDEQGTAIDSSDNAGNFTGLAIGTYTITVDDDNHCGPVTKTVEVPESDNCELVIYDAFSPNGDGINDVWNIHGIQAYPNCVVKIFNSWGTQVFSSKGYTKPWDGTFDGKTLPAGTYYYIIDLGAGEKTYSGSVNIIK